VLVWHEHALAALAHAEKALQQKERKHVCCAALVVACTGILSSAAASGNWQRR
jgi:hypothetical protein